MGWRFDLGDKTPQQRAIIMRRDAEERIRKEEANRRKSNQKDISTGTKIFPTAILMKLTRGNSGNFDGIKTIDIYRDFCKENQSVWFSSNVLAAGMSKTRQNLFLKALYESYVIEMYFVIGKTGWGANEIMFKANIVDIKSSRQHLPSPDPSLTPTVWRNDNCTIWIKITNLQDFHALSVKEFSIESTGKNLYEVLERSQYSFGYIVSKR